MNTGHGIDDRIFDALYSGDIIATHFPMLHRRGIPDIGVTTAVRLTLEQYQAVI